MSDISQGSVATHMRCAGIFSDNVTTNFLLIPTVKKQKLAKYLTKLLAYKNFVPFFGPPRKLNLN